MRRVLFQYFLVNDARGAVPQLIRRGAMLGMLGMVLLSFMAANLQALLWQSSGWLVATILPAVVVELTNEERVAEATLPLQRSAVLDEAARRKAEHMVAQQYFAHYSPEGVSPWAWFDEVGYRYAHAGENLAIHFSDSSEVVEAWMHSPTHRANIVNDVYSEIGVGTAQGMFNGHPTVFVVQLFGTPALGVAATSLSPAVSATALESVVPETETATSVEVASSVEVPLVAGESQPGVIMTATPTPTVSATIRRETTPRATTEMVEAATLVVDPVALPDTVVSVYSNTAATSSGLPVLLGMPQSTSGATKTTLISRVATQPNTVLQTLYAVLGCLVVGMLALSFSLALRAHRFREALYSVALVLLMGGLIYIHLYVTSGAVVA